MKKLFFLLVMLASAVLLAQKVEKNSDSIAVAKIFNGRTGAFVIFNAKTKKYFRYNVGRCAERFKPASTFKIPNSLIGLETGAIKDENFVIKWDGVKRWNEDWNKDNTLASAIKFSVLPYYQELARRVGKVQYNKWIDAISYGNQVVGDSVDAFWLDNSLKISADEQVAFLKRFYDYKLPFSKRNVDIVKKIMPEEKYKKSVLKFKTGTGEKEDGKWLGWIVGYVLKNENVNYFAFNIEASSFEEVIKLRNETSRKILKTIKAIE